MGFFSTLFGLKQRGIEIEARANEAQEALDRGDALGAFRRALAALEEEPRAERLLRVAGLAQNVRGDAAGAELFGRAASRPEDVGAWLELGMHLREQGEPRAAAAVLDVAVELDPFHAIVRSELALAYAHSGRPDDAMAALAVHPCLGSDPGVLFQFGWSSMLAGDLEAAEHALHLLEDGNAPVALSSRLRRSLERTVHPAASSPPDARDYYYLEYGGVVLARGEKGGTFGPLEVGAEFVSRASRALRGVLAEVTSASPTACFALTPGDTDVTRLVASELGLSAESLPEAGRVPKGVVVSAGAHAFGTIVRRLDGAIAGGAVLFALTLERDKPCAVAPNVVGAIAERSRVRLEALDKTGLDVDAAARFAAERKDALGLSWRAMQGAYAYTPDLPCVRQK
jgi:hypothetical protein